MARTVDPERHQARRLVIIDAAMTRFAADGYDRTSTAAICRAARIGSGTFFHYFPTKLSLLLAILELGTQETVDWFSAQAERADPRSVIDDYLAHVLEEYADPRVAGFVRAVGSIAGEPEVAAALDRDTAAITAGLGEWIRSAQGVGDVRDDVEAEVLAQWVFIVLDGFLARLASADGFTASAQGSMLRDTVARLLAPNTGIR